MLQLNRAKFSSNGNCGYVLKPPCMCQGEARGPGGQLQGCTGTAGDSFSRSPALPGIAGGELGSPPAVGLVCTPVSAPTCGLGSASVGAAASFPDTSVP